MSNFVNLSKLISLRLDILGRIYRFCCHYRFFVNHIINFFWAYISWVIHIFYSCPYWDNHFHIVCHINLCKYLYKGDVIVCLISKKKKKNFGSLFDEKIIHSRMRGIINISQSYFRRVQNILCKRSYITKVTLMGP